jgi:hypothetical protein
VESSTAVECALAGVPCYLCGWFDLDLHAYGKQYQKFGAARVLDSPAEILRIPDWLGLSARPEATDRLHHAIAPEDLRTILQSGEYVGHEISRKEVRPAVDRMLNLPKS